MLKKKLVPTPLVARKGDTRVSLEPMRGNRMLFVFGLTLRVLWHIAMTKLRASPHDSKGKYTPNRLAVMVRTDMERLGGLWIKAAQIMAMRRDIFPKIFCDELSTLHDRAVGFPGEAAVKIIEDELGKPISEMFSEFDIVPIAAASIGQVHVAYLREGGAKVAIKVQRPGIVESMNSDLAIIAGYISFLRWFPSLKWMLLEDMYKNLETTIADELDYRLEAGAIRRMRRTLKTGRVYAPKLFAQFSSRKVLTMEFVDGVLLSDYINMLVQDPKRAKKWCKENKISPKKFGEEIYLDYLKQLLFDNLSHGDLHPGNIMMLRNNRFALIDFGSISVLDRGFLQKFVIAIRALALRDFAKYADVYLTLLTGIPSVDIDVLRKEIVRELEEWEAIADVTAVPYEERSLLSGLSRLNAIVAKYELPAIWAMLRVLRSMAALDASLKYLIPKENWFKVTEKHFQRERRYLFNISGSGQSRQATLGALLDLAQLPANFGENIMFQGELVRKRAMNFQATISKAAEVGRAVVTTAVNVGLIGTVFLAARYLSKETNVGTTAVANLPVRDIFASMPTLSPGMWVVVIVTSLYLLQNLRKLGKVLGLTGVSKNPFV